MRRPLKNAKKTVPAVFEVREGNYFQKHIAYVATESEAKALCTGMEHSRFYHVAAWAHPEDVESVRAEVIAARS